MKKILFITFGLLSALVSRSQTVSTFESLTLANDSFWDGSDQPLGATFSNGNALFPNFFDTSYGGYWTGGWAYSNMTDTITPDYNNIYSAIPGKGYNGSNNFILGQQNSMIKLTGKALGKMVQGFYITNSTYASYSLRDGDFVCKKFGGATGKDKDFFKLKIQKYYGGVLSNDSVVFYLADYRSDDSTKDYIVKDWRWVDLSSLGNVDSLTFELISSDNGQFGMNTPAFFCMDNFTTKDAGLNLSSIKEPLNVNVFPNPAINQLIIELPNKLPSTTEIIISDITGRSIKTIQTDSNINEIDVTEWAKGIYFVTANANQISVTKTFIKQ